LWCIGRGCLRHWRCLTSLMNNCIELFFYTIKAWIAVVNTQWMIIFNIETRWYLSKHNKGNRKKQKETVFILKETVLILNESKTLLRGVW
jgi:hypothetical protein